MRDAARIAYAQARAQARFGGRPGEGLWRELEAGRDLPHLIELLRGSALHRAVESLPAAIEPHALESRLRGHWSAACSEVARWYPDAWRPALEWLGTLPWVAPLAWSEHRPEASEWAGEHPLLGNTAAAAALSALADGPLHPLSASARQDRTLAQAWHDHWRATWPRTDGRQRAALDRLAATVGEFLPGGPDTEPFDPLVERAEVTATRVFRRQAGTAIAGLALLVLLALDHLRLRAALAVASSFGPVGVP
jgi:hypothetical protein